jgi:hypothetical protein
MSLEDYRKIVEERIAKIDRAIKRLENFEYSSTFIWSAIESLVLAKLEIQNDLKQHERVDRENDLAKRAVEPEVEG